MLTPATIFFKSKFQLVVLILIAIGLNVNTLFHEYALDDILVLTENNFVKKGINGIPEILSSDYVSGYSTEKNIIPGARYRPLALILFALEYQFFGADPMVSHLMNILLFGLLVAMLYQLLQAQVFREKNENLAFLSTLIFAVHPIHTEVIANVKSRDEILAFLLMIVSLSVFLRFTKNKKTWLFILSMFCYLLALLSKESAAIFVGVIPLVSYFFYHLSIKKSIFISVPFVFVFIFYMLLRYFVVGFAHYPVTDITNAPFLYASVEESFATKIFILSKYLWLQVFPFSLTTEYGYNQIPYLQINSHEFILSMVLLLSLSFYSVYTIKKRSVISFCIIYYFVAISVAGNFIIDLGITIGERMLFVPSFAFCIAFAYLILNFNSRIYAAILVFLVLISFSIKTIVRNSEWKNNETLFLADVVTSPNSARMNLYACETYIIKANKENNLQTKDGFLKKAIYYGEQSLKIHSKSADAYLRLGFAYFHLYDYFKAANQWILAKKIDPKDPDVLKWTQYLSQGLYMQGNGYSEKGLIDDAIMCYLKSTQLNESNAEAWYNLGGNYFLKNDSNTATFAWSKVKVLKPEHRFKKEDFITDFKMKKY